MVVRSGPVGGAGFACRYELADPRDVATDSVLPTRQAFGGFGASYLIAGWSLMASCVRWVSATIPMVRVYRVMRWSIWGLSPKSSRAFRCRCVQPICSIVKYVVAEGITRLVAVDLSVSTTASAKALLALVLLSGAGYAALLRVVDDTGHTLVLLAPARRIVSLAPHLTEQLFAAGAGERLVGVARFKRLSCRCAPVAGGWRLRRSGCRGGVAAQTDLVLAWSTGNQAALLGPLQRMGIPVFWSQPERSTMLPTASSVWACSPIVPRLPSGLRRLSASAGTIGARYAGAAPVQVFAQIWDQPPTTVSNAHVIGDMVRLCGGCKCVWLGAGIDAAGFGRVRAARRSAGYCWRQALRRTPPVAAGRGWSQISAGTAAAQMCGGSRLAVALHATHPACRRPGLCLFYARARLTDLPGPPVIQAA